MSLYKKLRFNRTCVIDVDGKPVRGRIVYGNFPFGYGRDATCLPEIVIDEKGITYRPLTICTDGPWCVCENGYLKRIGLTRKQVGGAA